METLTQKPIAAIAIYCTTLELGNEPFSSTYYWEAYADIILALKARGVQAYLTTGLASYQGRGRFKTAYTIDGKASLDNLTQVDNIEVDLVFDRAESLGFSGQDITVINDDFLREIARNKFETYEHFGRFQPYSIICNSQAALRHAFGVIEGDKVVAKALTGSGGRQVYIGDKADVLKQASDIGQYPLLAQEFLDTSAGVPGKEAGVHDIRVTICGGEIVGYYIRVAKAGAYHSNVSQGGTMTFLPAHTVPPAVAEMVAEIDQLFSAAPRYYAADFVHSNQGWKLIELNSCLALIPEFEGPDAQYTSGKLADYLVKVAVTSRNLAICA